MTVHLIKLAVGSDSVEDLDAWVRKRVKESREEGGPGWSYHDTRMVPKRAEDLMRGGSIYWVIRGFLQARQELASIETIVESDGREACRLWLTPEVVRVEASPLRPFQGWRYLEPGDAPPDVRADGKGVNPKLAAALKDSLAW